MIDNQYKVDYPARTNFRQSIVGKDDTVESYFRFGCGYADISKDGRHAWILDLYQRNLIITGKALAMDVPRLPCADDIVKVSGKFIKNDDDFYIWVRDISVSHNCIANVCAIDLATPAWIFNQSAADEFSVIWHSLGCEFRELINNVLSDTYILKCFLSAPGSVKHHDSVTGGCLEHTVLVARTADAICKLNMHLNRDLLVAGAILHDIGKCLEYEKNGYGNWRMTSFGKKIGHKVGGALLISEAAAKCKLLDANKKEDILHLVTSSYAPSWAGYRYPDCAEAHALSAIDRICAISSVKH